MNKKMFQWITGGCFGLCVLALQIQGFQYNIGPWSWYLMMGFIAVMVGVFLDKRLVALIGAGVTTLVGLVFMFQTLSYHSAFGYFFYNFLYFAAYGLLAATVLMTILPNKGKLAFFGGIAAAGTCFLAFVVQLIVARYTTFPAVIRILGFMGGAFLLGFMYGMDEIRRSAAARAAAPRAPAYPQQPQWQGQAQPMYPGQPQWQAPGQPAYPGQPQWQAPAQPAYPAQPQWQAPAAPAEPQPWTPPAEPVPPAEPQPWTPPAEPVDYTQAAEPVPPAEPQPWTPPAESASAVPVSLKLEQLKPLQDLLGQGLITPEEYEAKRREIMGR